MFVSFAIPATDLALFQTYYLLPQCNGNMNLFLSPKSLRVVDFWEPGRNYFHPKIQLLSRKSSLSPAILAG